MFQVSATQKSEVLSQATEMLALILIALIDHKEKIKKITEQNDTNAKQGDK